MTYLQCLCAVFIGLCLSTKAQSFNPVDDKSTISFTVKNFGLNVNGTFSNLQGAITFDPQNLKNSLFDVSVESGTLDTGIDLRDKHIKKEDYLDVVHYSQITFRSTEITSEKKSRSYLVKGNLTIKDVTREIQFPFTSELADNGVTLTGSFTINRRNYNVGGKSISMSDIVDVQIKVFALKTSTESTNSR